MFTFRRVSQGDFDIISTFPQNAQELFYMGPKSEFPITGEQLEQIASTRHCPTVVLDGERIAGYANFYGLEPGSHAWLGNVIIQADYRGKGAAGVLIAEMLRLAGTELHVPKLQLACHNTNVTALLFYNKLGFRPFGLNVMKNYDGETIVGILMELETIGEESERLKPV